MRRVAWRVSVLVVAVLSTAAPGPEAPGLLPTGTITGTVTLEPPPPPRRSANRYPGAPPTVQRIQLPPAIVYLEGAIAGSPPPGYVGNPTMLQQDTAFVPGAVALQVGGTVSFPNGDPFFHNVISYSSVKRFDLGRYPQGESKEIVFDKPGIVEVGCEVHEFMSGIILVSENPYHAVVDDDGTFTIEGIPPGEYTMTVWHVEHRPVERSVTVTDGGTARIEVELRR